MASLKRELPESNEPEPKKAKVAVEESSEGNPNPNPNKRVVLNPADCNLDFNIEENGLQGSSLHEKGFAYCWSGARANVGITGGKYCFSCKIVLTQTVNMEDTPPNQQHVCRVGISRGDDTVGNLGETEHSFGFGGTGKFSNAGKFSNFGEKFGVGDTILCAVDLESKPLASIGFSKNGKWLGISKQFNAGPNGLGVVDSATKDLQWESALFAHVLVKNVVFEVQFSVEEGLIPQEGYKPWSSALEDGNAIVGPTFSNLKDCEVMMMVGLPASGKSTWAEKWVKEHPEKRYVLLGTNLVLDQMKVSGLLRKNNYGERFDHLMDRATAIFNTLLSRAAKTPRNYIIDQTNVYKNARKRKLKPFVNFQKIAVVVFPKPEELKNRAKNRFKDMGKEVPDEAVNEMLANYVLPMSKDMPSSDDIFDQVMFPELNRLDSQRYLEEMKRALSSTSNESVKSYASPCFQENSVHSYTAPLLQNLGVSSVTSRPWQNSAHPLPPSLLYQRPDQVISTCLEATGLQGTAGLFSGPHQINQNPPLSRDSSFGTHLSYSSGADPYRSYGVNDPYRRPSSESWGFVSRGFCDPNHTSNVAAYNSYPGERAGSYESPVARSSATLAYNTHRVHCSYSGVPLQPNMQAPRGYAFLPVHPPTTYGERAGSYESPGANSSATLAYNTHGVHSSYSGVSLQPNMPAPRGSAFLPGHPPTTYGERAGSYESQVANSSATLAYNTHGVHSSYSEDPLQPNMQAPRGSAFLPGHPPATYGSPNAAPTPRPNANLRPDMQQSGVYPAPPYPRYY